MKITNRLNLPSAIVKAVTPTEPHNKERCVSATTLLHGVKDIILTKRHWTDMTADASNRIFAAFGTAIHKVFEEADKENPDVITEQEYSIKVGSYIVTGRIDCYDARANILVDYKSTSVYKVQGGKYDDWRNQLLIYCYLMKRNGVDVNKATIYAICRDWSRSEALRNQNRGYPASQTIAIPFVYTEEDFKAIEEFINTKVAEIERCDALEDDLIPECTPSERWAKEPTFAVLKVGGKKALKTFKTKEEAEVFKTSFKDKKDYADYFVEDRPGSSPRCQDYCDSCQFCSFYKENIEPNLRG